jgi:hypothetical protein
MRFTPIFGVFGLFAVCLVAVGANLSQPPMPQSSDQISLSSDRRVELAGTIERQGFTCPEAKSAVYEKTDQTEVSVVVECGAKGAAQADTQYRITMLSAGPTRVERKS